MLEDLNASFGMNICTRTLTQEITCSFEELCPSTPPTDPGILTHVGLGMLGVTAPPAPTFG
jgi:hypothetical protein